MQEVINARILTQLRIRVNPGLINDERLTGIVKGYAMQAFFYHTTFDPFCDDKNCRLFNAHWQEDMMHAQLDGEDICGKHRRVLEGIKK